MRRYGGRFEPRPGGGEKAAALDRRAVLPLLALAPCALATALPAERAADAGRKEIVIVDGWVLTRHDLRKLS